MKTTHLLSSHSSSAQNEKLWGGGGCLDRTRGLWQRECWRQLYYYQLASPVGSRQHRIHSGGRGNLIEPPPPTLWVAGDACWLGAAGVSSQVPTIFRGHVPLTQPCVPITTLITDNIGGETTEKPDGGWCLEIWESWVLQFYQRWQWDEWLLVVVVSGAWHQRCPDYVQPSHWPKAAPYWPLIGHLSGQVTIPDPGAAQSPGTHLAQKHMRPLQTLRYTSPEHARPSIVHGQLGPWPGS